MIGLELYPFEVSSLYLIIPLCRNLIRELPKDISDRGSVIDIFLRQDDECQSIVFTPLDDSVNW